MEVRKTENVHIIILSSLITYNYIVLQVAKFLATLLYLIGKNNISKFILTQKINLWTEVESGF